MVLKRSPASGRPRTRSLALGPFGAFELLAATPALVLALYILATTPADRRFPGFLLELGVCAAAALSTRWPLAGSISTGVGLTVLALVTNGETRMSAFACMVPLIACGARGRWRLTMGLTLWYLLALSVLEAPEGHPINLLHAALTWSLVLCIALLIGGGLDRIRANQQALREARETDLLEQRRTIARELHDTISHTATLTLLRATTAREHLDNPEQMGRELDYLIESCQQMTVDLRSLLGAMRAPITRAIDDGPRLSPTTALSRARTTLERAGFRPSVLSDGAIDDLPAPARSALAQTVTEASANIVRHGEPQSDCSLLVERTEDGVEFVATNTIGSVPFEHSNGYGLLGLAERIRAIGGELNVSSIPPNWVLHARIPLNLSLEAKHP